MDKKPEDLEAWADEFLAQHRTAPAGAAKGAAGQHKLSEEDSFSMRLLTALGDGQPPDPLMLERLRASQATHQAISKGYTASAIVAVIFSVLLLYGMYNAFL